ncbi:MAG: T9SS type A sorting domain-containing protein, partial [Candidatus Krumholzibacteriota bacterium]|nr:T9SS type A sorting domain-containing protein [Candidatus Krumholzibacteriota bacterium]
TGFSNTHVNALVNDNMLPFIVSVACVNGSFASTTCFAEAWLQASHGVEPTGAVGMYASTVNQSWAPPMSAQDEIVDLLVAGAKRTYGALCFNGACQMMDDYGADGVDEYLYWTIFGDPSLRVRTDTPTALAVSHAGVIVPLAETFEADTEPGALVALSDGGVFIGAAFADAGGHAVVPIAGTLPAPGTTATLTVTSFNRVPHVEEVLVGDLLVPTCDVSPGAFVENMLNDEVRTDYLHIANDGEPGSTLYYAIALVDPNYPRAAAPAPRNLTGSDCVADLAEFLPGTTVDITFTVSCVSNDSEWIKDVVIDFPAGTVVNAATPFTGGSGGDIPYNGATGDGVAAEWHGTGTYGDIYPNESATATVNVTFASPTGDVVLDWTLFGDDWGNPPHEVAGQIVIALAGPNVAVVAPDGGEAWGIGETRTIEYVAAGGPTSVTIELYRGLAYGWETLVAGHPAAAGSFAWTVTGPVSADCLVRVSDADDPGVSDTSDAAFTIYRPLDWVALDQMAGQIPCGELDDILVTFDSTGLPEGTYEAEIVITSNAGDPVVVPVTVHVTEDLTPAGQAPAALALGQNHPNPFNPRTTISFGLPEAGPATLAIFDVGGRRVRTLVSGELGAGRHHVVWDGRGDTGRSLASGVYFYRLETDGQVLGRKMLLLK